MMAKAPGNRIVSKNEIIVSRRRYPIHDSFITALRQYCRTHDCESIAAAISAQCLRDHDLKLLSITINPFWEKTRLESPARDNRLFAEECLSDDFDIARYPWGTEIEALVSDKNGRFAMLGLRLGGRSTETDPLERLQMLLGEQRAAVSADEAGPDADEIIARLIHQIRNPLATVIISASQLAVKNGRTYDDDDHMLINIINSEADRLEQMLARCSRFIRAESVELVETDLADLLSCLQKNARAGVPDEYDLEWELAGDLVGTRLLMDTGKLCQAILQAIENAIDFAAGQPVKIRIAFKKLSDRIKIIISDNGPGIRPELLRKVKEPFFSTKDGGSGLGLSMAEKTVRAHGGSLAIESQPGSGTRVIITISGKQFT